MNLAQAFPHAVLAELWSLLVFTGLLGSPFYRGKNQGREVRQLSRAKAWDGSWNGPCHCFSSCTLPLPTWLLPAGKQHSWAGGRHSTHLGP